MANRGLFSSRRGQTAPPATTENTAGGAAYERSAEEALAVFAATGTFNDTFYTEGSKHLENVLEVAGKCSDNFIAHTAVYARHKAYMKDMPAALCAILHARKAPALRIIFPLVINNGKMLRTFVQMVRSGRFGRKSFGTSAKRMIAQWLNWKHPNSIFRWSVGQDPSIADVIKMVHPKPKDEERNALYAYLIGKDGFREFAKLPHLVRQYEDYKTRKMRPLPEELGRTVEVPDVPFQMLTALDLGKAEWTEIARNAPWMMTRMNLNTFQRHGVFEDPEMVRLVAARLRNPKLIREARAFPYQLLMAWLATGGEQQSAPRDRLRFTAGFGGSRLYLPSYPTTPQRTRTQQGMVPLEIIDALEAALEISVESVPELDLQAYVCVDTSGSMTSPITGQRRGSTSRVRCVDVAALIAAVFMRRNRATGILPFDTQVYNLGLNPKDTIMTNAQKLARNGGGTNCALPMALLNQQKAKGDLVVFISDYEAWAEYRYYRRDLGTGLQQEWNAYKSRNPKAKLVAINLVPTSSTQVVPGNDVYPVAGFSDLVFDFIASVAKGGASGEYWVDQIKATTLGDPNVPTEAPKPA